MWSSIGRDDLGPLSMIDGLFSEIQRGTPTAFPRLHSGTLLLASDYTGEHRGARFRGYSFLLTDGESWRRWEPLRSELRSRLGLSRRLAYKNLGDSRRSAALPDFLNATGQLEGILVTFLVDRRIKTLFGDTGGDLDSWKVGSREKVARVLHFSSLLVAGLSTPGQNLLWFTDEDAIASNDRQLTLLTDLFARLCSHLLTHGLGHMRCGTTASDPGDLSIEDLVAIPDLVGGAAAAVFGEFAERMGESATGVFAAPTDSIPEKAHRLFSWFANPSVPLRRYVCVVRSIDDGKSCHVRVMHFPTYVD